MRKGESTGEGHDIDKRAQQEKRADRTGEKLADAIKTGIDSSDGREKADHLLHEWTLFVDALEGKSLSPEGIEQVVTLLKGINAFLNLRSTPKGKDAIEKLIDILKNRYRL